VLNNAHDTDDAFQATFLVLIRKAASLRERQTVGNWLYGVAYHTALKARAIDRKRTAKERQVSDMPPAEARSEHEHQDWKALLDEELSRLPNKYRESIVLCDLQGKSRQEAASELSLPVGTISGRLTTARRLLAKRFQRRGLVFASSMLAGLMSQSAASACVSNSTISSIVNAASQMQAGNALTEGVLSAQVVALAEGVTKAMMFTKIKVVTTILLVVVSVVGGASWYAESALAQKPQPAAPKEGVKPPKPGREKPVAASEISGTVLSVDLTQHTVTIQSKSFIGGKAFEVAKDAKVLLDDASGDKFGFHEGKFTDLSEGASVTLKLAGDKNQASGIWIHAPVVQGNVKAVDAAKSTIAIYNYSKAEPSGELVFQVAPNARISIEDGNAKKEKNKVDTLADLVAGAQVSLKLSVDRKEVRAIFAQGQTVYGSLKQVNGEKNTLTITAKDGEKTFEVAKDVQISIDSGKGDKRSQTTAKLTDLTVPSLVTLRLSMDQKSVVAVHAEGANINGVIKAVDVQNNSITVTVHASKTDPVVDHTFTVNKDARISVDDNKVAKLADLPVASHVSVKLSADQKSVIFIQAEGTKIYGTVKGAPGNDTITVGNKVGEETYKVAADTKILLDDGKEGKLADIMDGSVVSARLSANKKEIIGAISAAGPSFQGVVKAVDATNITLTIGGKNGVGGEDKTFPLAKSTQVLTGGKRSVPGKLGDVVPEKIVSLQLSVDQKSATRIVIQEQ
jgi:RNA polymerase sigma factor (sigma-70 family)